MLPPGDADREITGGRRPGSLPGCFFHFPQITGFSFGFPKDPSLAGGATAITGGEFAALWKQYFRSSKVRRCLVHWFVTVR